MKMIGLLYPTSPTAPSPNNFDIVVGDSEHLGASRAEFGGVSRVVYRLFPEMS